ncbi:MAG: hypothetical protein H7Y07_11200 [Pyrinomonadaceae bacterium]|nr:hypothetical protein [Sphingobacteriaceae bacterium]
MEIPTFYIKNSGNHDHLNQLVNPVNDVKKIVFKSFFDSSSKMFLVAFGGKSKNEDFMPGIKLIPMATHSQTFSREISVGDVEIGKETGPADKRDLNVLRGLVGNTTELFVILYPKLETKDGKDYVIYQFYTVQRLEDFSPEPSSLISKLLPIKPNPSPPYNGY